MKKIIVICLFLISLSDIIHTFYKLTIEPIFTSNLTTLSYFGLFVLIIECIVLENSFNYIKKELPVATQVIQNEF